MKRKRTFLVPVMILFIAFLVACEKNTLPTSPENDSSKQDNLINPVIETDKHELEMVSSQWGFGTTNNWVLSADTGFFCITRDDRGIYPTWYDPENMTRKSLGTEQLLPYMEQYMLFSAGDRLVACTEENSRINIISPPYEEVTETYQIKDQTGKITRAPSFTTDKTIRFIVLSMKKTP